MTTTSTSSTQVAGTRPVDPTLFRKACGEFLTGVTVVTSLDRDGRPVGFTANAFSSVSLDPPMVLVCLGRSASSYPALEAADRFAVHVMAEPHEEIVGTFARSASEGIDKFGSVAWAPADASGLPLLEDYLSRFQCRITDRHEAGDHVIIVGEVEDVDVAEDQAPPIGYFRGKFERLR